MQSLFIKNPIAYDGSQLSSHWILKQTGVYGDAIVSFAGPCDVKNTSMVDLEDVLALSRIYSESMLHFIIEHFDRDLEKMVLRQRLFIAIMQSQLSSLSHEDVLRDGDDLFLNEKKLTVSIATASPVSCLIHTGINIVSDNTPVPAMGLKDLGIDTTSFAEKAMASYLAEMEGVQKARVKVRGVP